MTKVAFLALRLAGIIGWAVRDDATSRPTAVDLKKPTALLTSEQFKQKLRDNAPLRARLEPQYPDTWRQLAVQARGKLNTCVVTELQPACCGPTAAEHFWRNPMIDLYAAGTSNGMRARIALEECGLPYKLNFIDLAKGENRTPQFLAMNPNGQIPVIVDHEGPGGKPVTLSQSTAILLYCAEKSGKFLPKDPATRPAMLQALMSASTDVTPIFGALTATVRAKEPHPPTVQIFKDRLRSFFKVWDGQLAKTKYAAGGEITVADLSLLAGWLRTKGAQPELVEGMPNLTRWGEELSARPAVQRALKF